MSVFVAGSLHYDVVVDAPRLPALDETLIGQQVAYVFGGKGGNQAVAASRHGATTAFAGRVGDDAAGRFLADGLTAAGVDIAQVQIGKGESSGMSVAIVDAAGSYGAVVVSAANRVINASAITLPADTRIVMLQNEVPEAVNIAVAHTARARGARVLLNAAPMRSMAQELLALVDILVVNRVEAAELLGFDTASVERNALLHCVGYQSAERAGAFLPLEGEVVAQRPEGVRSGQRPHPRPSVGPSPSRGGKSAEPFWPHPTANVAAGHGSDEMDPVSSVGIARPHHFPALVVTLGGDGLLLLADGAVRAMPAFPATVVSTHGAGDAFCGALAARLDAGDIIEEALAYAQAAAALHVSTPVNQRSAITPDAVRALMGEGNRGR